MGDTKERILLTSLQLFAQKGYAAVPVSDIAGALGITKGALYRHFESKQAIFDAILARMEQRDGEPWAISFPSAGPCSATGRRTPSPPPFAGC